MEDIAKIFSPTIQRSLSAYKSNLYDLIKVKPADSIVTLTATKNDERDLCVPRTEKYYIPKKRSKLKVKTVRDIRKSFEEDVFSYLPNELEKQQNILLRKIRCGFSRDQETNVLAKKILKADTPISRASWQMLININPEQQLYPKQYVMWNEKYIQVNGSKGGKDKFLCKNNLANKEIWIKNPKTYSKKGVSKKKGLLRNSLAIKFKPGPLGRKKNLDDSHQKYHVGDIEIINLPKPGLDIQPKLGTSLEPSITRFLNNLRNIDGTISQKWAELAVSVLGTIKKSKSDFSQTHKESVTFELSYKFNQHRILMRRDMESFHMLKIDNGSSYQKSRDNNEHLVLPEIEDVMTKILDTVEISLNQQNMFSDEDKNPDCILYNEKPDHNMITKDKLKRKYCELDRLDVTVIRLPGESQKTCTENCNKPFCSLGCVCDSLTGPLSFKQHCGRLDCMFKCKCNFSKYKNSADMDCDLIPGLLNLDSKLNLKLAKEEQKFHQTVIVTDEKSILLKAQKRNTKAPKKYAEFYTNMELKQEAPQTKPFSILAVKLDCKNIEPWCMVHNLYKCFCKGKFTQSCKSTYNEPISIEEDDTDQDKDVKASKHKVVSCDNNDEFDPCNDKSTCSRVNPYKGRQYKDVYYRETNRKIFKMEENDISLRQKMINILNKDIHKHVHENKNISASTAPRETSLKHYTGKVKKAKTCEVTDTCKTTNKEAPALKMCTSIEKAPILSNETASELPDKSANLSQIITGINEVLTQPEDSGMDLRSKTRRLPNKTKLVAWLESNYKMFKDRVDRGITKIVLEAPKVGKVALYPWDFILDRYRERKNIFLISKSKPFRIFMAVNTNIPAFENCININDIRFAELQNYPLTVKNLLTNATDLKDNFCILCGLAGCWEVIGSVTKVNESNNASIHSASSSTEPSNSFALNPTWSEKSDKSFECHQIDSTHSESPQLGSSDDTESLEISVDDTSPYQNKEKANEISVEVSDQRLEDSTYKDETSKWFVMTVENDFSEIRFYKKGFFVKYESILKAINVARMSVKTVRLSSQKCVDKNNGPQFGIYAIPNANEYCVFVGPYETDESLGIETIKTILDVRKSKRTRGFWITTSKIDNLKVIDNPLSFMPHKSSLSKQTVTLDNSYFPNDHVESHDKNQIDSHEVDKANHHVSPPSTKVVKPIKIRKTNGFYHLASSGLLKKISPQPTSSRSLLLNPKKSKIIKVSKGLKQVVPQELPLKITSVYATRKETNESSVTNSEIGMFILKPDEINKLFEDDFSSEIKNKVLTRLDHDDQSHINKNNTMSSEIHLRQEDSKMDLNCDDKITAERNSAKLDPIMEMDVKSLLFGPSGHRASKDDVCVISDDDGEQNPENRRQLWIESLNTNLGWNRGRRKSNLPYNNVFVPTSQSAWTTVETKKKHKEEEPSTSQYDTSTTTETATQELLAEDMGNTGLESNSSSSQSPGPSSASQADTASLTLPEEELPWNQADAKSSYILNSVANASDSVKRSMKEALNNIMSLVKDLDEK